MRASSAGPTRVSTASAPLPLPPPRMPARSSRTVPPAAGGRRTRKSTVSAVSRAAASAEVATASAEVATASASGRASRPPWVHVADGAGSDDDDGGGGEGESAGGRGGGGSGARPEISARGSRVRRWKGGLGGWLELPVLELSVLLYLQ